MENRLHPSPDWQPDAESIALLESVERMSAEEVEALVHRFNRQLLPWPVRWLCFALDFLEIFAERMRLREGLSRATTAGMIVQPF